MRRRCLEFILTLACILPSAFAANVQKPGLILPPTARAHRDAVQKIFTTSYADYKQFAFGHDELAPISKTSIDDLNGWGASIVDAMTTMAVMGLDDLFAEAVNFTSHTDYSVSKTSDLVSVFETTIRHVAGLLSAYELSGEKFPALVAKAKQVADKMAFAWVGTNDIPFGHIDFSENAPNEVITNIAEAGTLTLEWSRLSIYTGNDTYRQLAEKSVRHIANLATPFPGLAPQLVDPASGQFADSYLTWGGGSDSYFEYLIKYARITNTNDPLFADTWRTAVDSSIQQLLKTSTVGNHVYLADFDGEEILHIGSHLACFHGGNWLFGGKLLNNQTIVNIGLQLVDACWNTYASTATGIGPETFAFISPDGNATGNGAPTPQQLAFFQKHGFYITGSDYIQRPEVLESNFYAWRVTGDTKYLDRAASAVASFNKFLPVPGGFASLNDVDNFSAGFIDDQESFWFAEVLKYLYLTFDDPNHISLDQFVFNTECHPFKAPPTKASYGSGALTPHKPFTPTPPHGPIPAISPNPALPTPLKTPSRSR